ncbi:MAG: hypothetical protein WCW31_01725 [Patescibacteria group bacterium]
MATTTPDILSPEALRTCAERVVNDKKVFQASLHSLLEAAKNPEVLENLLTQLSEEEKGVVLRAVEILREKHRLPSVPPSPPSEPAVLDHAEPGSAPVPAGPTQP